ncbi:hypothetical protein [Candidatus Ishikawella capsulata]|uniref:hypothetical protein n=1 Tax=Candidatus Ishikawella capsulata TaxID=168169 RepID=UPI00387E95E7
MRKFHRGCALTMGHFDCIHRCHKYFLKNYATKIYKYKIPVMLFETHQLEFLLGSQVKFQRI